MEQVCGVRAHGAALPAGRTPASGCPVCGLSRTLPFAPKSLKLRMSSNLGSRFNSLLHPMSVTGLGWGPRPTPSSVTLRRTPRTQRALVLLTETYHSDSRQRGGQGTCPGEPGQLPGWSCRSHRTCHVPQQLTVGHLWSIIPRRLLGPALGVVMGTGHASPPAWHV